MGQSVGAPHSSPFTKLPQRRGNSAQVGQREKRDLREACGYRPSGEQARKPPVKAHATLVEGEDLERMGEVVAVAVEEHVTCARAEHHADNGAHHKREQIVLGHAEPPALRDAVDDEGGQGEAEHVGQPIPAHDKRPQREGDRIEALVDFVQHYRFPS